MADPAGGFSFINTDGQAGSSLPISEQRIHHLSDLTVAASE